MRVIHKQTGQLGDIPDDRFDPALFEVPQPAPQALPPITTRPQKGMGEQIIDGGKAVANFLMPKITAAGSAVVNTAGMAKDYMDYAGSRSVSDREAQAKSYTERKNKANEALKQFGFDANKEGNQFDPVKYGTGTLAGAGEAASFVAPVGKGITGMIKTGATTGGLQAIDEPENIASSAAAGALTGGVLGAGGKLAKGAGKVLLNTAEDVGLRGFGFTSKDLNKLNKKFKGKDVNEFLSKENLVGKTYDDVESAHDVLQTQFDEIVDNPRVQVDGKRVVSGLLKKAEEYAKEAPTGMKKLAEQIKNEAINLQSKYGDGPIPGSELTRTRRLYDQFTTAKHFMSDPDTAGFNKQVRDVLQDTIREAADTAGLKTKEGLSLKDLGSKLSEYKSFIELAADRSNKDRGTNLIGITQAVGGAGGISYSMSDGFQAEKDLPLIAGSILAPRILNNPKVLSAISTFAQKMGKGIDQLSQNEILQAASNSGVNLAEITASNAITNPKNNSNESTQSQPSDQSSNGVQGSVVTGNSSNTIPQVPPVSTPDTLPPITTSQMITIQNPETGETKQVRPDEMEQYGLNPDGTPLEQTGIPSEEEFKAELIRQMQAGNTKGVNSMIAMYDKLYKQDAADKPLSAEAQKTKTKADTALAAVTRIEEKLNKNPELLMNKMNPFDQSGRVLDADMRSAIDIIGSFRTGATLTEDQRKDYLAMFPSVLDDPQTKAAKLAAIKAELAGYAGVQPDVAVPAASGYMPEITTSYP